MNRTAVLDENVLAGLRELEEDGSDDLLAELIALFLEDAPCRLRDLGQALEKNDADAAMRVAHSLKGSAGNLGARGLAALCSNLELRGRGGDLRGAEAVYSTLLKEFVVVREALESERRHGQAAAPAA
jgi:HPt (histidine-containing phosphotransfer) domain-containing protein